LLALLADAIDAMVRGGAARGVARASRGGVGESLLQFLVGIFSQKLLYGSA
jgi:hypothetical protein